MILTRGQNYLMAIISSGGNVGIIKYGHERHLAGLYNDAVPDVAR
jgi:hypothetical protein